MLSELPLGRRLWIGCLAGSGIVAAHSLAYLMISPDPHSRTELLRATGHGSEGLMWTLGIGLAFAAVVSLFLDRIMTRPGGARSPLPTTGLLAALQVTGFLALESFERLRAGSPLTEMPFEMPVVVGLLVQVVVAALAILLARALASVVDRIVAARRLFPGTQRIALRPPRDRLVPSAGRTWEPRSLRGPPSADRVV